MAGAADIQAGKATVATGVDLSGLTAGLKKAGESVKGWGAGMKTALAGVMAGGLGMGMMPAIGAALTGWGKLLPGLVAPWTDFVESTREGGDALHKMAGRTGATVEGLSELRFAAEQSGQSLDSVERALRPMSRSLDDAVQRGGAAAAAFARLGLSVDGLRKLDPADQLTAIVDALAAVPHGAERAAIAMDVFGRAGTALLPMAGSARSLRGEARGLGIGGSSANAQNAADLTDSMNRYNRVAGAVKSQIANLMIPALTRYYDAILPLVVAFRDWVKGMSDTWRTLFTLSAGVAGAGVALATLGVSLKVLGMGLSTVAVAFKMVTFTVGLLTSPVGAATIALGAFAVAAAADSDAAAAAFEQFAGRMAEVWAGINDAVAAGEIGLAFKIAFAGARLEWAQFVDWLGGWSLPRFADLGYYLMAGFANAIWGIQTAWNQAVGYIRKSWASLMGWVGGSSAAAVQQAIDEQQARLDALNEGMKAQWRADVAAEKEGHASPNAAGVEAARAELDALREQAEYDRGLAELDDWLNRTRPAAAGGPEMRKGGGAAEAAALGTFSADVVGRMGVAGSLAERTATAAEETASNTRRMMQDLAEGGYQ